MADIPDNPATALERIFTAVRGSGQNSIKGVWETVLEAHHGTPEFYKRHGEVVNLVSRLHSYLLCLPDTDPTRTRNINDVVLWYQAVVPTRNWDEKFGAWDGLITDYNVRLLGALGHILSLQSTDAQLTAPEIAQLRESLKKWKSVLEDAGLPDALRVEIQQQVEHIEWLLGSAEKFGYEPIVHQSRTLFGMGFSVVKVTGNVAKVATAVGTLFQFITHISVHDYGQAMNALAGLTSSASEVFAIASEQENQTAIEGKKQKAAIGSRKKAIGPGKKAVAKKAPAKRKPRKAAKKAQEPPRVDLSGTDYIDAEILELPESPTPEDKAQG